MVLAVLGSIFLISSGSITTYSSLRYSYPFTMSLRSTTLPSARQTYCCFSRDRSSRCSMLKEMLELRAPENKRTGMEINPKVRYPVQTEAAIVHPAKLDHAKRVFMT